MFGQRLAGRSAARITRALRTVAAILANPRYTGLGHRQVQQWNLPEG
jgi:hypothetical protein